VTLLDAGTSPVEELEAKPWYVWLAAILPAHCTHPFAEHHVEFWEWVWSIEAGRSPSPPASVNIWARGGAKSTSAEGACAALGARGRRRYGLYVCDTQDRADDHVANIGAMLESERVEMFYPGSANRLVGKFGNSKGWRRNRLRTASGFTIDAIGLDTAARGVKVEDQRPDLIVLDDIDGEHDTARTTSRKVATITKGVLPAGSDDVAVIAIQNLVTPHGVFARLADGRADYLTDRQMSGPIPALRNFRVDAEGLVHGVPTWAGQDLEKCRRDVRLYGIRSFREEAQHDVAEVEGALWVHDQIEATRVRIEPDMDAVTVAVDPAGGEGASHDEVGIVAVGRGIDGHGYVLGDWSDSLGARKWGRRAVLAALEVGAQRIVGEKNYGGDMVVETVRVAVERLVAEDPETYGDARSIVIDTVNATNGKRVRAQPVADLFGEKEDPDSWGRATMHVVGQLSALEAEMVATDFDMGDSPNRVDALVWAAHDRFKGLFRGGRSRGAHVVVRAAA